MGVDYGAKKIGFALSDEEQTIAFPKAVIPNEWAQIQAFLNTIFAENDIGEVVTGLPVGLSGAETELSAAARRFARKIEEAYAKTIYFENEVYSSAAVRTATGEAQPKGIDAASAAMILQSFLDRRRSRSVVE